MVYEQVRMNNDIIKRKSLYYRSKYRLLGLSKFMLDRTGLKMTLNNFKLPAPESRLIIHNGVIYKIKLAYKYVKANAFLPCAPAVMQREVEAALRAVLHKDNQLKPLKVKTGHFLIDCEIQRWAAAKHLGFEENGVEVPSYPETIVITVQPKPGRRSSAAYQAINVNSKYGSDKGNGANVSITPSQNDRKRKLKEEENNANATSTDASKTKQSLTLKNVTKNQKECSARASSLSVPDPRCLISNKGQQSGYVYKYKSKNVHASKTGTQNLKSETSATDTDSSEEGGETDQALTKTSRVIVARRRSRTQRRNEQTCDKSSDCDSDEDEIKRTRKLRKSEQIVNDGESEVTDDEENQVSQKSNSNSLSRSSTRKMRSSEDEASQRSLKSGTKLKPLEQNTKHTIRYSLRKRRNKQSSRMLETRYSLRKRNERTMYKDTETESDISDQCSEVSENSPSSSATKTRVVSEDKARVKSAAVSKIEKLNPGSAASDDEQTSGNDANLRRSKRLKTLAQNDLLPTKRMKSNQQDCDHVNNTKRTTTATTSTQTRGSAYRVKSGDIKELKKLVVPLKAIDQQQYSQRPKRVLHTYPSTNEDIGSRSTNREPLCYQRDRTLIQQEELAEEMKLQQMALASSNGKPLTRSSGNEQKRRRSLLVSTLEGLIKPVKSLFK